MTPLREAAQQALEAWDGGDTEWFKRAYTVMENVRAALAEPVLQTCNCRWDGEMQMQQCTLHEAHVDAIKEWAQRAKFAEKKLAALAEQRLTDMEQKMERSIESLKSALAEPVQEPVAGRAFLERILAAIEGVIDVADRKTDEFDALRSCVIDLTLMLHTAPPQRKPLTEEEIDNIWDSEKVFADIYAITRAIERAHGIV